MYYFNEIFIQSKKNKLLEANTYQTKLYTILLELLYNFKILLMSDPVYLVVM